MQELIDKKITGIDYSKKHFILNTTEGDIDLMDLYQVRGRSLYLIPDIKKSLSEGHFIDGIIMNVNEYEGDSALGKNNVVIKQKRLTLSIGLKFKPEAKVADEKIVITFCE